jgi:hypothetical protein
MKTAYDLGLETGRDWIGPYSDGSLGSLSAQFIEEQAEMFAAGYRFAELDDGPTNVEERAKAEWLRGHRDALRAAA